MNERDIRLGNGLLLGEKHDVFVSELDFGDSDYVSQDVANPLTGATTFGRDYLTRSEITMTLYSNRTDMKEALASLRAVSQWWARGANMKPGEYTSLGFMLGGQLYTVYGRPRKHSVITDKLSRHGVAKMVVTFARADNLFYAPSESLKLTLNGSTKGGLRSPLRAPLTTGAKPGRREGQTFNSSATSPSPFTARFYGPSKNPTLTVGGKKLSLSITIPYDRSVIVDTRAQTVKWADTKANIVGALSQSSRLSQMRVPVGDNEIVYQASDVTNNSYCVVSWSPAQSSF